jgi:zinc/manganese transport system substrate-binding protein
MRCRNVVVLLTSLFASATAVAELRVFTCEPEWAALTEEIGGELVQIDAAITGHQDVHYIQARPSLIAKVRKADLIICTGAELEVAWLPLLLRQSGNPDVQPGRSGFLAASDYVDLLEVPVSVDRSGGDIHPFGNPHLQLDPRNIAAVAEVLAERLALLDPDNGEHYASRYSDFRDRWRVATEKWTAQAENVAGMDIVSHHNSWVYLINWLGLIQVGTLEEKPGIEPGARHLAALLKTIDERDVRLIVRSTYQSPRASKWLSGKTGIPAEVLPHTVGSTDEAGDLFSWYDALIAKLTAVAD